MVLYLGYCTRCFIHGECDLNFPESEELILTISRQFGGVGVNCHQPFGTKRLVCPYDPKTPAPYEPVLFEGLGDQNYSGDFECESSDSIQTEANPLPDASQFLSSDQISRVEQFLPYDQDEPQSPVGGIQIASKDEFSPFSENMDSFQLLDSGPGMIFDEGRSGSQLESDIFPDITDYPIIDQDTPADENWNDSLFPDTDLFA